MYAIRSYYGVEHHIEEVGTVGKIMARVNQRPAHGFFIGKGGNRTHLGNEACGHDVNVFQGVFRHLGIKV